MSKVVESGVRWLDTNDFHFKLHVHTAVLLLSAFLTLSYGAALSAVLGHALAHDILDLAWTGAAAAATACLAYLLVLVGNRCRTPALYWPAILYTMVWSFDQTCDSVLKSAAHLHALFGSEALKEQVILPLHHEWLATFLDDLLLDLVRPFVGFGVLVVLFCGRVYLTETSQRRADVVYELRPLASPDKPDPVHGQPPAV